MNLPGNPYDNNEVWPVLLLWPFSKSGRAALLDMVGIHPAPAPVPMPDLQYVTCCDDWCPGLVARDGCCTQCNIKFAALIICPNCGWKQGVMNADKFDFKCWKCHAHVADS